MELRQLRYFVILARTLSFSEASQCLCITQGTLSQQIRQLEDELGVSLFERSTRSVSLTEAGTELLPLARETIEASEACLGRMKDLRGVLTGTLNIGTTKSFCPLLADTMKFFLKANPGVDVRVHIAIAADLLKMTRNREVDLALAYRPLMDLDDIESETLFKTRLCVVMRRDHPLAEKKSVSLDDLEGRSVIMPGGRLQVRRTLDHFVDIDTRRLKVRMEINDPEMVMDVVQGTGYVSLMTQLSAWYRPGLVAVPLEGGRFVMDGCVHRMKSGYRKRSSDVFMDCLRESASLERLYKGLGG